MSFIRKDKYGRNESKKGNLVSNYPVKEAFVWLSHYIFGPSKMKKGNVETIPKDYSLNEISPKYTISFIGDIMDLNFKDLIIDESVKRFIRGADFLIGNFEGTLTTMKREVMDKRHKPQIMDALDTLFPPKRTYLSIANNHGGDFGPRNFLNSVNQLKERGFNVFGTGKNPFVDLNDNIRVLGGTQWTNHPCNYIYNLTEPEKYLKHHAFNILFPHWGCELELHPRSKIIKKGKVLLGRFDAVVGQHSHCPQPVSYYTNGGANKLIAYSLGDFCIGWDDNKMKFEMFRYGIAMKIEIGPNNEGKLQVGKVDWTFLKSRPLTEKEFTVETVKSIPNLTALRFRLPFDHIKNTLHALRNPNHQKEYSWNIICARNRLKN